MASIDHHHPIPTPTSVPNSTPNPTQKHYKLSQHVEFDKPACPMNCEACRTWSCIGQTRLSSHQGAFSAIIGIGTLGGGFTFTVIFTPFDDRNGTLTAEVLQQSRQYLVIAWVLFVLAVTGASVFSFQYRVNALPMIESFDQFRWKVNVFAACALYSLQSLILAAFFLSAEALKIYDAAAANVAVALLSLAAVAIGAAWGVEILMLDGGRKRWSGGQIICICLMTLGHE